MPDGYFIFNGRRERSMRTPLCPIHIRRLMANPNNILAFESRFGPQSNLIDVAAFVRSASDQTSFQVGEIDHDIIQECRYGILFPTPFKMGFTRTGTA